MIFSPITSIGCRMIFLLVFAFCFTSTLPNKSSLYKECSMLNIYRVSHVISKFLLSYNFDCTANLSLRIKHTNKPYLSIQYLVLTMFLWACKFLIYSSIFSIIGNKYSFQASFLGGLAFFTFHYKYL